MNRSIEIARHRGTPRGEDWESLGDGELVRHCAKGEARAWKAIVQRYRRLVYAVPYRAGLDADRAEEVFHETFSKLAESIGSIREPERVRAWVVTTARRLTIDAIRERTNQKRNESDEFLLNLADDKTQIPEEIERLETQHLVRRAISEIPAPCRRLISKLFYYTDKPPSYEALAEDLEIPIGSIGPTRARCLKKLLLEFRRLERES